MILLLYFCMYMPNLWVTNLIFRPGVTCHHIAHRKISTQWLIRLHQWMALPGTSLPNTHFTGHEPFLCLGLCLDSQWFFSLASFWWKRPHTSASAHDSPLEQSSIIYSECMFSSQSQSHVNCWNNPLQCIQYMHAHPQHPSVLFHYILISNSHSLLQVTMIRRDTWETANSLW